MPIKKGKTERGTDVQIFLSVLGYREGSRWVALALEMDVRGYGKTFSEAQNDLLDLINMQISFARFKKQPTLIFRPADPVWFGRFAEARNQRLRELMQEPRRNSEYQVSGLPIPRPHVIANLLSSFHEVYG